MYTWIGLDMVHAWLVWFWGVPVMWILLSLLMKWVTVIICVEIRVQMFHKLNLGTFVNDERAACMTYYLFVERFKQASQQLEIHVWNISHTQLPNLSKHFVLLTFTRSLAEECVSWQTKNSHWWWTSQKQHSHWWWTTLSFLWNSLYTVLSKDVSDTFHKMMHAIHLQLRFHLSWEDKISLVSCGWSFSVYICGWMATCFPDSQLRPLARLTWEAKAKISLVTVVSWLGLKFACVHLWVGAHLCLSWDSWQDW